MHLYTRILLGVLIFYLPKNTIAQNNKVNNTTQTWSEIDFSGKINTHWKWQLDVQYSRQSKYEQYNLLKYNSQFTLRPWVHYYINPNTRLSAFYGLWDNFAIKDVGARAYTEYRGAIQANFYSLKKMDIVTKRIRTELRFIKDKNGIYETVLRERAQLKYQHLMKGTTYSTNTIYFISFDEFFLNSGSNVTGHHVFDQNRLFLGFGYNITNDITFETGYFNQLQQHTRDTNFDMNHVWQLTLMVDNI